MAKTTHKFASETNQILKLVIHSLYSNQEIFLRELISNAADACDKLSFLALKEPQKYKLEQDLSIHLSFDAKAKTLTISDNGIGMSQEDAINNLGTIANSGTKAFLEQLKLNKNNSNLIGQFGVGFYSCFMVANAVSVETKTFGHDAICWHSDGENGYSIEPSKRTEVGTSITLQLKDEQFANEFTLKNLVKKYSDHIKWPIKLSTIKDDKPEINTINSNKALWTLSKQDISETDYNDFYKQLTNDYSDPICYSHNQVEGKSEYTLLLYIPKKAPFDLFHKEHKAGLNLYIQRVFIMANASMLPGYLRFVKGVVDANDLPLNISREILQSSHANITVLKNAIIKRSLAMLKKLAKDESLYKEFFNEFGSVLKEGLVEDHQNQAQIADLIRFSTNKHEFTSFADYKARMAKDQKHIHYLTSTNLATAKNSPHLEPYAKKQEEVILFTDRVDEWVVAHLTKYDDIELKSINKSEQKPDEKPDPSITRITNALKDKIKFAKASSSLISAPSRILLDENAMNLNMRKMLEASGQAVPKDLPILEVNLQHKLVQAILKQPNDNSMGIILDLALILEGEAIENPNEFMANLADMFSD